MTKVSLPPERLMDQDARSSPRDQAFPVWQAHGFAPSSERGGLPPRPRPGKMGKVVLSRESGEGKLEEVDILHEEKRRCTRRNEHLRKSSNWKRFSWGKPAPNRWPRLPAIWGLPTVRCTIGVSSKLRRLSKPFPAVGIRRLKKRNSGVSAREVEILRHAVLEARGIQYSRKRVVRLLQTLGLEAVTKKRRKPTTRSAPGGRFAQGQLNREFAASWPKQKWVTQTKAVETRDRLALPGGDPGSVLAPGGGLGDGCDRR
jgi:hypothetical protein